MYHVREIRNKIEGMVVEPQSEEGQEIINDGRSHVLEVWEDGEVTSTKAGDLYGHRSIHQSKKPFIPVGRSLFRVDDPDEMRQLRSRDTHKRMVVKNDEVLDILAEYRSVLIDDELIQHLEETGFERE